MRGKISGRGAAVLLVGLLAACNAGVGPVGAPVASVTIEPKDGVWTGTLAVGQTVALAARARAVDGSELPPGPVAWSTADSTVAVVDGAGVLQARGVGTTEVRGTVRGKSGTIQVVVVTDVALVLVSPGAAVLQLGERRQYEARVFDASQRELFGRRVAWSTAWPDVVAIDSTGMVRAVAAGYGDVTATVEGRAGHVGLTVVPPEPSARGR